MKSFQGCHIAFWHPFLFVYFCSCFVVLFCILRETKGRADRAFKKLNLGKHFCLSSWICKDDAQMSLLTDFSNLPSRDTFCFRWMKNLLSCSEGCFSVKSVDMKLYEFLFKSISFENASLHYKTQCP